MSDRSHVGLMVCFWCGRDAGVALDRRLRPTMPHRAVFDYNPCTECRHEWAKGVVLIEATREPRLEGAERLGKLGGEGGAYPTGRWAVIKPEAARRIFGGVLEANCRRALIEPEAAEKCGLFTTPTEEEVVR